MASPYYRPNYHSSNSQSSLHSRSSTSSSSSMYSRNNPSAASNGGSNRNNRDRINETNVTLMEMENNQRWVRAFLVLCSSFWHFLWLQAELGEQVDLLKEVRFQSLFYEYFWFLNSWARISIRRWKVRIACWTIWLASFANRFFVLKRSSPSNS